MRNEDGVWCDLDKCNKPALNIHYCRVEQSEFAFCLRHGREWQEQTRNQPDKNIRCPRCLPSYLAKTMPNDPNSSALPEAITGPLAEAFAEAMHREGILRPTINRVLQRLAAVDDVYVRGILRSTMVTEGYEDRVG